MLVFDDRARDDTVHRFVTELVSMGRTMGITVIDTQPETLKYHTQPIDSIADTQLGVATQCMLGKHVPKANKRYCTNLCPKVDNKIAYAAIVWDRFFFGQ